jgi:hypothetical protein
MSLLLQTALCACLLSASPDLHGAEKQTWLAREPEIHVVSARDGLVQFKITSPADKGIYLDLSRGALGDVRCIHVKGLDDSGRCSTRNSVFPDGFWSPTALESDLETTATLAQRLVYLDARSSVSVSVPWDVLFRGLPVGRAKASSLVPKLLYYPTPEEGAERVGTRVLVDPSLEKRSQSGWHKVVMGVHYLGSEQFSYTVTADPACQNVLRVELRERRHVVTETTIALSKSTADGSAARYIDEVMSELDRCVSTTAPCDMRTAQRCILVVKTDKNAPVRRWCVRDRPSLDDSLPLFAGFLELTTDIGQPKMYRIRETYSLGKQWDVRTPQ